MIEIKNERNYGGAYDIDPEQYFTKDDLLELADEVCDNINEVYHLEERPDITDLYIEDNVIHMTICMDYMETPVSCTIDMRRINKPSDLKDKYCMCFVSQIRDEMDQFYMDNNEDNLDDEFDEGNYPIHYPYDIDAEEDYYDEYLD